MERDGNPRNIINKHLLKTNKAATLLGGRLRYISFPPCLTSLADIWYVCIFIVCTIMVSMMGSAQSKAYFTKEITPSTSANKASYFGCRLWRYSLGDWPRCFVQ